MAKAIYLSPTYDADLCNLYLDVGIKEFRKLLKDALKSIARPGYEPKTRVPRIITKHENLPGRIRVVLNMASEADRDVIGLLNHIQPRKISLFCKMALRYHIGRGPVLSSLLDVELTVKTVYSVEDSYILAGAPQIAAPRRSPAHGKTPPVKPVTPTADLPAEDAFSAVPELSTESIPTPNTADDDFDILAVLENLM